MIRMRISANSPQLAQALKRRSFFPPKAEETVRSILEDIKTNGDRAVFKYARLYDNTELTESNLFVTESEFRDAYECVSPELLLALTNAADNIRRYHMRQVRDSWALSDGMTGMKYTPIQKAGVYVPGGAASYPSSVLMNVIPAKVAGVEDIIVATPAKNGEIAPLTLVAAREAGADRVLKVGGAQAIGALAYGTGLIPAVDKITGPGNVYVAIAKREVFGYVGVDMIAGPSELLIIADESADPAFVAADLLSQAEHDPMAVCSLITLSKDFSEAVLEQISKQTQRLSRREIIEKSLKDNCLFIEADNLKQAAEIANTIAPEHLELMVEEPHALLENIRNAGAVFLGHWSPEPLGDYYAGPNHVLPTNGTARFSSPLGVDDFIKRTSIIDYSQGALGAAAEDIICLAEAEGLAAHANSIKVRVFKEEQ